MSLSMVLSFYVVTGISVLWTCGYYVSQSVLDLISLYFLMVSVVDACGWAQYFIAMVNENVV
jgi:hypothetical protein